MWIFISYFPLKNFFETNKPKFLIIHLMTSLPLLLNLIYKYDTKIILRISGKPKLNFVRYYFWKIALKKVFMVTFPTIETMNYFKTLKLVDERKISLLYDPIISTREITKKLRKEPIEEKELRDKIFFLAIGRLTVQKNFKFLIESFSELIKKDNLINLVIIGDGEQFNLLKNMINEKRIKGVCEIANDNAEGQTIISGDTKSINLLQVILKENKKKFIPLNVSAPFHCSLMRSAANTMKDKINSVNFKKPNFDVVSNVTSKPENNPDNIKKLLIEQICSSVRWRESIINISKEKVNDFIEIGPGKILTGMVKRTLKDINCFSINSIDDMKKITNEFKK